MIGQRNIDVIVDEEGSQIVLINDIRFKGKRKINWEEVKQYLRGYIGNYYQIEVTADKIYIGNELPEEYTESESRKSLKGTTAKAKANAATALPELIQIAVNPDFEVNTKNKHKKRNEQATTRCVVKTHFSYI